MSNGPVDVDVDDDTSQGFVPETPTDGGKKDASSIAFTCKRTGSAATGTLVINEVDYDQPGNDDGEFIEIYNPSASSTVSLSGYQIVLLNGSQIGDGGRRDYDHIALSGTLAPKGYFVVADPGVPVAPGAGVLRLTANQSIQNGPSDAIALMKDGDIVDSLSYGGALADPCNFVEGTAMKAYDSNSVAGSLIRDPNGSDTGNADVDWKFTNTLTPGKANVFTRAQ